MEEKMFKIGKLAAISLMVISGGMAFAADNFPSDFDAAMKLKSKPVEAEAAFIKLAETAKEDRYQKIRRDAAYFEAADSAAAQKEYARALTFSDKISSIPMRTLSKMNLMKCQKQYKEILELTKNEKIAEWPEALIFDGAMCRAEAEVSTGDYSAAEKDYILAKSYTLAPNRKAEAALKLGDIYRDNLKDDANAMKSYDEVIAISTVNWRFYNAGMSYARIAVKLNQGAQAIERLNKLNASDKKNVNPQFIASMHECYGDVYLAMGKKDESLASYRQALAVASVPEAVVKSVEEKIKKMGK
jgi:tetratricopeptide (TPR) repeat protein